MDHLRPSWTISDHLEPSQEVHRRFKETRLRKVSCALRRQGDSDEDACGDNPDWSWGEHLQSDIFLLEEFAYKTPSKSKIVKDLIEEVLLGVTLNTDYIVNMNDEVLDREIEDKMNEIKAMELEEVLEKKMSERAPST